VASLRKDISIQQWEAGARIEGPDELWVKQMKENIVNIYLAQYIFSKEKYSNSQHIQLLMTFPG